MGSGANYFFALAGFFVSVRPATYLGGVAEA
jgi:hypothetical protein